MPGQPKKQRERERVNPAYGYIATTIRLRSRLLSSTELGTEQLGSQWDHISTTAPVGRNKMASAIRLLFQIPRRRAQSFVSFFSFFLFFFLSFPSSILRIAPRIFRPIGRLHILRHRGFPLPLRGFRFDKEKLKRKRNILLRSFSFLFSLSFTMVCAPRNARSINEISKETRYRPLTRIFLRQHLSALQRCFVHVLT